MPTRTFHAYLDRQCTSTVSQALFERITDPRIRAPFRVLAGRRIQFITLYVDFDGDTPVELTHVEPVWISFDDDGRRDKAETERARRATVDLLDELPSDTDSSTVIPAAARFVFAGIRWEPTAKQLNTVLRLHGLHEQLGTPPEPLGDVYEDIDLPLPPLPEQRHLHLVPTQPRRRPPITSAELNASLDKRWASWHPDCDTDVRLWLIWDDVDSAVENLALLAIDKLYDELTGQGLVTGECITFAMFPSTIEGHLPPLPASLRASVHSPKR